MTKKEITPVIIALANMHGLEPGIIYGICMTESNLSTVACRYEPAFRWLLDPEKVRPFDCSLSTETILQKCSWGLMQVMGAVLRELGFRGWITGILLSPTDQVDYGCRHLRKKIDKYGYDEGVLAYNSGKPIRDGQGRYINQKYLDRVLFYSRDF